MKVSALALVLSLLACLALLALARKDEHAERVEGEMGISLKRSAEQAPP